MKLLIEVEVQRVGGRNHSASAVAEHICSRHIRPGEIPADPGNIWVGDTHYRVVKAEPRAI